MQNITASELKDKLESGEDIILLDVRETYEHEEFNIGGTLIPLGQLPTRMHELDQYKSKEIVAYCRSGNRSALAQHLLTQKGFDSVYNLQGGVLAWKELEDK